MARVEPERAKKLLTAAFLESLPDNSRSNLINNVAASLTVRNPADTAAWAATLTSEKARTAAYQATSSAWANADPVAAAEWLETLPSGKERDIATASYANTVRSADPEGATVWASTIQDGGVRQNTIENIARDWLKSDKAAATTWLKSTTTLTAEAKAKLLPTPK